MFKVKSRTDVITNSSTEVFITAEISPGIQELAKYLHLRDGDNFWLFDTPEKIRKYLVEDKISTDKFECPQNPFEECSPMSYLIDNLGKSEDELWEFFKPAFEGLLGKAFMRFCMEGMYNYDPEKDIKDWEKEHPEFKLKYSVDHDWF